MQIEKRYLSEAILVGSVTIFNRGGMVEMAGGRGMRRGALRVYHTARLAALPS